MQAEPARRSSHFTALDRIDEALRRDDRETALQEIDQAGRDDPFNEEVPLLGALLHLEAGRPSPAAEMAVRALERRPFHPGAMNLLAVACLDAEEPQLARELLLRAVRMAPGLETLRANLEIARMRLDEKPDPSRPARPTSMLPRKAIRRLLERNRPTLSACVLLEDGQERQLQACLNSLRSAVDEFVIADRRTSGGDLQGLDGARTTVVALGPEHDRASCRDAALRRSSGAWVLVLDADERVARDSVEQLASALDDDDCICRLVRLAPGPGVPPRRAARLVRNAPGLRFHPIADDCVIPSVAALEAEWKLAIGDSALRIERDAEAAALTTRAERGRRVSRSRIERVLGQDPLDVNALYARARLELEEGAGERALATVRQAKGILAGEPRRLRAIELEEPTLLEGRCLMRLERHAELAALLADYHASYPATTGTLFLEGLAAKGLKQPRRAAELLEAAAEARDVPGFAEVPPELLGAGLPDLLGATWLELGELERAAGAFGEALALEPQNLEAQLGRIAIRHARGEVEQMLEDLDGLVGLHGDDPQTWIAGGMLLAETPALAVPTVGWFEEAHVRFPQDAEIRRRLGEAHLRTGGAELALAVWQPADLRADRLIAGNLAAALAAGRELPSVSGGGPAGLERQVLAWFQSWMSSGAWEALDRALLDIERAERRLPGLGELTARWLESVGQSEAASGVRVRTAESRTALAPHA